MLLWGDGVTQKTKTEQTEGYKAFFSQKSAKKQDKQYNHLTGKTTNE